MPVYKFNINFAVMKVSCENNKEPLLSFIITFRELSFMQVSECLDSIYKLSLRATDKEIIVVDNGSDASIIDNLIKYRDDIIYVRLKKCGIGEARNLGLKIATGAYIQFVDGADKLIPDAYEHCLDIVRYHEPDIVLFNYSGKKKDVSSFSLPDPVDGARYLRHNNLQVIACGYVFRRKILMNLRFTPGLLNEDEEFTPLLFLRGEKVYSTDLVAYSYKKRPSGLIKGDNSKLVLKRLNDIERIIFHLYNMSERLPVADRQALQRRIAQLTMDYKIDTFIKTVESSIKPS